MHIKMKYAAALFATLFVLETVLLTCLVFPQQFREHAPVDEALVYRLSGSEGGLIMNRSNSEIKQPSVTGALFKTRPGSLFLSYFDFSGVLLLPPGMYQDSLEKWFSCQERENNAANNQEQFPSFVFGRLPSGFTRSARHFYLSAYRKVLWTAANPATGQAYFFWNETSPACFLLSVAFMVFILLCLTLSTWSWLNQPSFGKLWKVTAGSAAVLAGLQSGRYLAYVLADLVCRSCLPPARAFMLVQALDPVYTSVGYAAAGLLLAWFYSSVCRIKLDSRKVAVLSFLVLLLMSVDAFLSISVARYSCFCSLFA